MNRIRKILPFVAAMALLTSIVYAQEVKKADLAGTWYPGTKDALLSEIGSYFNAAKPKAVEGEIFALIAPHAGIRFSGPVAAYAFKTVQNKGFKTVIVLGFSHHKYYNGISILDRGVYRTPLGDAVIDEGLAKEITAQDQKIQYYPALFQSENSIELLIPFVQYALKDAKIIPIAFGTQDFADTELLADALARVLRNRKDVLVVASTDMSHYHPYDEANVIDRNTIAAFKAMNARDLYSKGRRKISEFCGLMSITAVTSLSNKLGFNKVAVLKYANSGDTFGDKNRVVGYLSAVIYKEIASSQLPVTGNQKKERKENVRGKSHMQGRLLNDAQRRRLLQIARESMTSYVLDGKRKNFSEPDPALNEVMGAFVTLHRDGQLRGCIGNMTGRGPLYQTVADMAIEAATGDPRFPKLTAQEIKKVDIEVSVLTPLKRVKGADEITIPGDGVIVKKGFRSGVYLPQVATETGWSKEEFLTSLCGHKAGLDPYAWKDPETELYVFAAEVFGEKE